MRTVILGPAPPLRGGIAQHTAGLAEALILEAYDVRVLGYSRQYPDLLFPGRSQYAGAEVVGEPIVDVLDPRSWREARAKIASYDCDRVIVEWWHPIAAPALTSILARLSGPTRTLICHNATPHEWFPASALALRRVLAHVDEILCHSGYVADSLRRISPATPVRTMAMPLLPRGDGSGIAASAESSQNPFVRRALFIGNIRSYKGLGRLLEAWAARDRRHVAVLSIVGEAYRGRRRLERLLRSAGNSDEVRWERSYLSDSALLTAVVSSDVLVLPYRSASQSGLLPVAAALRTCVIASDVGGLREQAGSGCDVRWVSANDVRDLSAELDRAFAGEPRSAASRRESLLAYDAARRSSWKRLVRTLAPESNQTARAKIRVGSSCGLE